MIHNSRKWRLVIRAVTLLFTSVLMLAFAGPASYALQDDSPKTVTSASQLFDKKKTVADSYVNLKAVPDLSHALSTKELIGTHYWIPLQGFNNEVIVRTDDSQYLFPYDYDAESGFANSSAVQYEGKAMLLKNDVNADKVIEELGKQGIVVDKDKVMIVSQGEEPKAYRPMVPVMPVLAWIWLAAFVGLLQIWRGRSSLTRARQSALAPRQVR